MLACRIHAKEDLRVEAADMPAVGPGEVLLRLGAGGICGSDLHYYFEGRNGSFVVREPLIPGHEASGVVEAVGPGVTRVKKGDKVALSPSHACGRCDYCREGREHLCTSMKFLGSASLFPHVQGMFREYFVLGERQCYPVAGDVSLGELAFAEPLAVALHTVNRGPQLIGKSVLVTCAGTIGSWRRRGRSEPTSPCAPIGRPTGSPRRSSTSATRSPAVSRRSNAASRPSSAAASSCRRARCRTNHCRS
jgi:L-idonate 5-dehydrogenase